MGQSKGGNCNVWKNEETYEEETHEERQEEILVAAKPNSPSKWSAAKAKAKAKFKVYPSAYANAWAAKEYKKMGGTWSGSDNRVKKRGKK